LIKLPEVASVFNEEIAKINKSLVEWERINRFRLVSDEWSPATGELSASLKLKRKVVAVKYKDLLDSIYMK
jgi:long-chain acyl-CoA synthetase